MFELRFPGFWRSFEALVRCPLARSSCRSLGILSEQFGLMVLIVYQSSVSSPFANNYSLVCDRPPSTELHSSTVANEMAP